MRTKSKGAKGPRAFEINGAFLATYYFLRLEHSGNRTNRSKGTRVFEEYVRTEAHRSQELENARYNQVKANRSQAIRLFEKTGANRAKGTKSKRVERD